MYQPSISISTSPWRNFWGQFAGSLAVFSLTVGCLSSQLQAATLPGIEAPFAAEAVVSANQLAQAPAKPSFPKDGVYLYGQSSKPDQIGQAYMVFEVRQQSVVGAFYMPNSSFDCFYGGLKPEKLALTVVDSYDQTRNDYAIALQSSSIASNTNTPRMSNLELQGFHPITKVSENDQRLLKTCKADFSNQKL